MKSNVNQVVVEKRHDEIMNEYTPNHLIITDFIKLESGGGGEAPRGDQGAADTCQLGHRRGVAARAGAARAEAAHRPHAQGA